MLQLSKYVGWVGFTQLRCGRLDRIALMKCSGIDIGIVKGGKCNGRTCYNRCG